jgi:hypothetical protein
MRLVRTEIAPTHNADRSARLTGGPRPARSQPRTCHLTRSRPSECDGESSALPPRAFPMALWFR